MNIKKEEEKEKSEYNSYIKSNELLNMNTLHLSEGVSKTKEKFSSLTNSNIEADILLNTALNNVTNNINNKNTTFNLAGESPGGFNFNNNLLVSPALDHKFSNLFYTPNKIFSTDSNINLSATPREIKFASPYNPNIINGLKHDERSSSFKRIKINHFPNEITGRSINFEMGESENVQMNRGNFGIGMNKTNNMNKIENFRSKTTKMTKTTFIPPNNMNNFINKKNFYFSSESLSDSDDADSFEVENIRENMRHTNSSMNFNDRGERGRKYTLQMSNNINFNTGSKDTNLVKKNLCCTCTKSKCLKKYCECFANNEYCYGCDCHNCYNIPKFKELIKRSLENNNTNKTNSEEREEEQGNNEIVCNCTKSNCRKKYCECFKAGEGCKELCRCINCENEKKITFNQQLNHKLALMSNNTQMDEKRKANRNPMNYILEGTSVYICNQDITVSFRKEILNKSYKEKKNEDTIIKNKNLGIKKETGSEFLNDNDNDENDFVLPEQSGKMNLSIINKLYDINSESIISSSGKYTIDKDKDKECNSESSITAREITFNSAYKQTSIAHLETPNIKRKRSRIQTTNLVNTSSPLMLQTPLFATTTSTHKNNNKKKVNLDQQIIKKLYNIY